jgi:hypothetical protein
MNSSFYSGRASTIARPARPLRFHPLDDERPGGTCPAFASLFHRGICGQRICGTGTLGKQSFLRIEGEFTLPSIRNDLFAGSSLL